MTVLELVELSRFGGNIIITTTTTMKIIINILNITIRKHIYHYESVVHALFLLNYTQQA